MAVVSQNLTERILEYLVELKKNKGKFLISMEKCGETLRSGIQNNSHRETINALIGRQEASRRDIQEIQAQEGTRVVPQKPELKPSTILTISLGKIAKNAKWDKMPRVQTKVAFTEDSMEMNGYRYNRNAQTIASNSLSYCHYRVSLGCRASARYNEEQQTVTVSFKDHSHGPTEGIPDQQVICKLCGLPFKNQELVIRHEKVHEVSN